MKKRLLLASASPRRRAMLAELGWNFAAVASEYEEISVEGETPEEMTRRFAFGKALDVFSRNRDAVVAAADTTVVIDNEILGKPKDEADACRMLSMLQGRKHTVMTAVAIFSAEHETVSFVEKTDVFFRKLSPEEIESYVATGESLDKAGAYAIQGHGMLLVEKIRGCYFNVVGLPVERLSKELDALGFSLKEQWGN